MKVKEFARSTRKNAKRGYVKEMPNGTFFACAHVKYNDARECKIFKDFNRACAYVKSNGYVVEI